MTSILEYLVQNVVSRFGYVGDEYGRTHGTSVRVLGIVEEVDDEGRESAVELHGGNWDRISRRCHVGTSMLFVGADHDSTASSRGRRRGGHVANG